MGNDVTCEYKRGGEDTALADVIRNITDDQYNNFLDEAENKGNMEIEEFKLTAGGRDRLIECLGDKDKVEPAIKKLVSDSLINKTAI